MTPKRTIAALLASGALLFAACGDDDDSASPEDTTETSAQDDSSTEDGGSDGGETGGGEAVDTVDIVDFEYAPVDATVAAGSEVTFTNADGTPHTATASDGSFNTDSIDSDGEGAITAPDEPGEYAYICSFHPFMKGTLIVE
ncbi:MAG: cupredoxin domain-containing protein [Acidimicrobiales bacterium]|nr:cupredoxin domain-containing protein [Acidimicrobiales bacterium]